MKEPGAETQRLQRFPIIALGRRKNEYRIRLSRSSQGVHSVRLWAKNQMRCDSWSSVKIMRLRFCSSNSNRQNAGSLDGYSVILILQDAFNPKEFLTVNHHAVFLVKVRIDNHVRNSCLIFQTQKDKAFGCSRTLPSDYASCYPRV